jgi:hypothetical protein
VANSRTAVSPHPVSAEPTWETRVEDSAPPGNVLPALARLLLALAATSPPEPKKSGSSTT